MKKFKNFLVSLMTLTMMLSGFTSGVFAATTKSNIAVYNNATAGTVYDLNLDMPSIPYGDPDDAYDGEDYDEYPGCLVKDGDNQIKLLLSVNKQNCVDGFTPN